MNINTDLLENKAIMNYKKVAFDMLRLSYPLLNDTELNIAIDYSVSKRFKDNNAIIDNNYKNKKINMTLAQLSDYIFSREPILTSYGVMFKKHSESKNPFSDLVWSFVQSRSVYKNKMFEYPKGSEMYKKYNLLQLLAKIDANALYGTLGNHSALYYNAYVAPSITTQGKSSISSSIMVFESFLSNNVKFDSLNDIVTFIHNVISEKDKRIFEDKDFIDTDKTFEEVFYKIMTNCGFSYIPDEDDMKIVWELLMNVDQENINRLFYKNNLYSFTENKSIKEAISYILQSLNQPFLDPNSPPEEIKYEIEELYKLFKEFIYYEYQIIDKVDKVDMMIRDNVLVTDTDSCIVCLDSWYRYVLGNTYDLPMKIKTQMVDDVSYCDTKEMDIKETDMFLDYDFYTDEVVEITKLRNPNKIVPQDGLRHSIINIMGYILGKLILLHMESFTKNSTRSYEEGKKCLLIMKNEYTFKTILLTDGKKNYATYQEVQEGHMVPKSESLHISGLNIDKVGLQESTRKKLKQILFEDILDSDKVDQLSILKKIAIFEDSIFRSIQIGEKTYYKPVNIKSMSNYENPMRIQGIKAALIYNTLKDSSLESIDMTKRNSIHVIKIDLTMDTIAKLKEINIELYNKIIKLMEIKEFQNGIDAIAIPQNVTVPNWILDFIDYNYIITYNIKNFPLESIGLYRENDNLNYTNILKL